MQPVRRLPMTRSRAKQLAGLIEQSNNNNNSTPSKTNGSSTLSASSTPISSGSSGHNSRRINNPQTNFRCVPKCPRPGVVGNSAEAVQCKRCKRFQHAACAGLTLPSRLSQKYEQDVAEKELSLFVCGYCLEEAGVRNCLTSSSSSSLAFLYQQQQQQQQNGGLSAAASKKKNNTMRNADSSDRSRKVESDDDDDEANGNLEARAHPEWSITETPDCPPADPQPFETAIAAGRKRLQDSGFRLVLFPGEKITAQMEQQILDCAQSSVNNATFSQAYPVYCVEEVKAARHPYLQGAAAVHLASNRIVAVVLSNGRDPYCDLKRTLANLRQQVTKKLVRLGDTSSSDDDARANSTDGAEKRKKSGAKRRQRTQDDADDDDDDDDDATINSKKMESASFLGVGLDADIKFHGNNSKSNILVLLGARKRFTQQMLAFDQADACVHFTFIVTHDDFRGKRLASTLLWIEMARWALRGRKHACVNLALEKFFEEENNDSEIDEDAAASSANNNSNNAKKNVNLVSDDDDDDDDDDGDEGQNISARTSSNQHDHHHQHHNNNVQCKISEASRRLYSSLKFAEVYPRYHADGSLRWTRKEEAAGRMMISLDFPKHFSGPNAPFAAAAAAAAAAVAKKK